MNESFIKIADAVRNQRYSDSLIVFVAGSIVRGETTAFSDIDLVVVKSFVPFAYRESFRFENVPIDAFVHDPETLNYFFVEVDRASGVPALPQMVKEGIELPGPNDTSRALKALASSIISLGPPPLKPLEEEWFRYMITDYLDDIRAPRSYAELIATASRLHGALADYYFRSHGFWSAKGKSIPRVFEEVSPEVYSRFQESFDLLFKIGDPSKVIAFAERLIKEAHHSLGEPYKGDAPKEWRKPLTLS